MIRSSALFAVALLAASPPPGPVDQVSLILARGMAAEAQGNGRGMLDAARALDAAGARAAEGEADLAAHWRTMARERGIRDPDPPLRGRALGPAYRRGRLDPGAALATEQVFLAGQKAVVALVPEPGRAFGIRIAAPDREICNLPARSPRATCAWLPVFTARVTINVANRSAAPASYYLVSN